MKTILITGATDGLGLATAMMLCHADHRVLIHGRSLTKLDLASRRIFRETGTTPAGIYCADLSDLAAVSQLADQIKADHGHLDVLINNAGVFTLAHPLTPSGLDARLVVNMIAPYLLTKKLLPILGTQSRVVNLSSAAQAPLDLPELSRGHRLSDGEAYAQSKLGITMWSNALAAQSALQGGMPIFIAVNPKSFLATPMVRTAYGVAGSDVSEGADILCRAALADEFAGASGAYYDNDTARFASPHADALNARRCLTLCAAMDQIITPYL